MGVFLTRKDDPAIFVRWTTNDVVTVGPLARLSIIMVGIVDNAAKFIPHVSTVNFQLVTDFYRYLVSPFQVVGYQYRVVIV